MATDVERLAVLIEAQTKSYENAMLRLETKTQKAIRAATQSVTGLDRQMASLGTRATQLAGLLGIGLSARGFQQLIDASTRVQNSLRVAGLAGDDLTKVYQSLFQSAQRNAAPIEALTQLYGRAALVQKELGASTEDMLRFTDKVAVALRVSGQSAEQSSGALLQLSQALGSGTVRAEEFNSILEGALPIAQAAAAGLKEAGGSVAQLRSLVVAGKVSSEAFFNAFLAGSTILDQKVGSAQMTVGQGFVQMQNALIDAAGKFNDATHFGAAFASEMLNIADGVRAVGDTLSALAGPLQTIAGWYQAAARAAQDFRERTGIESFFKGTSLIHGKIGFAPAADTAAAGTPETRTTAQLLAALGLGGAAPPANAISLTNFAAPGAGAKTLERQQKTYEKLAASLSLAQANLTATDREQAIANDLAKLGTDATERQRNSIALLSGQLYDQQKALQEFNETAQFFGESINDALGDLIFRGKSATDVLADLVEKLGEAALQAALLGTGPLAALFGTAPATSGGLGGLLGSIFGGFRAAGGSVAAGKAYMVGERGPELFIPRTGGMVAANGNGVDGGNVVAISVNVAGARGNSEIMDMVTRGVHGGLAAYDKALPARMKKIAADPRRL